ncbi:MAG: ComF family protein, partial [Gordonia sp. (in: high G+C Gram-positive bacteria)]|uniref:ComF family protein n=1 Tax=Gordonia sp. (in: high G+C Gram-positive bacteria) TaxID=84139 RepID=UPI003BB65E26
MVSRPAGVRRVLTAGLDLALPTECGGCSRPGEPWCARCAQRVIDDPIPVRPRADVGTDVWALGRYRGTLRSAVIALKEHRRTDLIPILGDVLTRGLVRLADADAFGEARAFGGPRTRDRLVLIPAPTRVLSARRRGGDPVTAVGAAAARRLGPRVAAVPL